MDEGCSNNRWDELCYVTLGGISGIVLLLSVVTLMGVVVNVRSWTDDIAIPVSKCCVIFKLCLVCENIIVPDLCV